MDGVTKLLFELKNLFERRAEGLGDAKGEVKGGGVFAGFQRDDGLACDAGAFGEFLLGHLVSRETKLPDVVANVWHVHDRR